MRIKTFLRLGAVLASAVALVLMAGVWHVTREADAWLRAQEQSQGVARDVANMLALTNEFVVHGGDRAAAQWRARLQQLRATVDQALAERDPGREHLLKLAQAIDDLPALFERLAQIGSQPATPLQVRRRELLLERLLSETQEVVEARHRWAHAIGQAQAREQRIHSAMVLAAPAVLLALLFAHLLLVQRRLLKPLQQLESAATAIRHGDLSVRCAVGRPGASDELSDAAHAVDAMALALGASEQRLRLITDSLPAFVGHVDADERYTFANAHFLRTGQGDPAQMIGRTMREERGEEIHARLSPYIARALAGEQVDFETSRLDADGRMTHRRSIYVPDRDASGRVQGFYAMTFDITARKQAELRQAASERLLKNVADNVPALVAYIDSEQRYRFANSRYRDWLGADPAAMIGRTVQDAVSADFHALIRPHLESALGGERVRWERRAEHDGRLRSYQADYIPDIDADGNILGCYALTIDTTESREAKEALARSERELLDLVNHIPATVAYFDMQQQCRYANDTGLRSQGLERADVPGVTLRTVLGDSNYAQHEPYVREALKGRRARLIGRIPFKGREAHFQAHLIPDRPEGGDQRGFYLMTFDITAVKEAQERQARAERQLRAISDNLPVLISYIDAEQRYAFLNATFQRWFGVAHEKAVGQRVVDVIGPVNDEARRSHLKRTLAGERVEFDIDMDMQGELRHLHSIYIPDIRPDGRVAGLFALVSDVTEIRQIQARLNQMARVDALTGLPNRCNFEERLPEAIARAARSGEPMTVMFLDVDHFKSINDGLGHAAGDAVLKEFAQRLKAAVRTTDFPARLAGDEFVVLLEGVHGERDAQVVADKIVAAMRRPFHAGGATLTVTTSIGVAFCAEPTPDSGLMDLADKALYEAKAAGRNTSRVRVLPAPPLRRLA